ncbi:hypothetical protein Agabi119p4_6134 [Agaricus bisporus var. burnettii]|uniref:Uncharacterized protein n=1 Tax=Agaricus bisporus var. burnettii TaxID=192524 RepID=A0A8H7KFQ6_AGABI|nr:hypothetical protein Agabi119p4_6134 [Agaricus bisporus var. burnettii]
MGMFTSSRNLFHVLTQHHRLYVLPSSILVPWSHYGGCEYPQPSRFNTSRRIEVVNLCEHSILIPRLRGANTIWEI